MRFFKKTVAWIIILICLGGFFYFFEEKVVEMEAVETAKRRLFSFAAEDVDFVEIKKGDNILTVKKSGQGWIIEKPLISYADQKVIKDMLSHTVKANIDGVLFEETEAEKLKEMGLNPPYLEVTLRTVNGERVNIAMGDRGPTQNITFAQIEGDARILRLHADVRAGFDKSTYDLRDKTVISIEPDNLKKVEIVWKKGDYINIHHPKANIWDTEGVPAGRSDLTKLLGTLYHIKGAEAKAFVDESPKDLTIYGLHSPRLKIRFIDNNNLLQTLLVGDRDKKRRGFYAIRGGEDNVILLEEDFLENIPDSAKDLEIKS